MAIRNCVVWDTSGPVIRSLRASPVPGWNFHHATTRSEAERLVRSRDCRVGLIAMCPSNGPAPAAIEAVVGQHVTEWIAVVDRTPPVEHELGRLLGDCFLDFHTQPLDVARLAATIGHAYGKATLRRRRRPDGAAGQRYGMIGRSAAMQSLFRLLDKVVQSDAAVLIEGESGTGKELVARAVHQHSARGAGPFIAMNCGALPATLVQSELFGYERGAFTGATRGKIGNIEAANGGVLFLDEIVDLPLDQQANLLRVLQERALVRIGSTRPVPVDVRVVAATNVDLHAAVEAGRFRADLFYRLNVLHVRLPPLRERDEDIVRLAQYAFDKVVDRRPGSRLRGFGEDALAALRAHRWPGNVRELLNRVQQAVVVGEGRLITPSDLGLAECAPSETHEGLPLEQARAKMDRDLLARTLERNRNNVSLTARDLGVSRVTVYRMMSRYGIER